MQIATLGWQRRLCGLDELFEKFLLRDRIHKLQCRDMVLRFDEPPADSGKDADVRRQRGGRSFGEKIAMVEAMRERLAPLKRIRQERRLNPKYLNP